MGIADLRKQLSDLAGGSEMTMRYENGGLIQVFRIGGVDARVGPMANADDIRLAYQMAKSANQ